MIDGPLLPNIISYTIPIILTSLLQLLFNAADLVVVGQANGSNSLAAVGATGAITNLIVNLFIGLSVGCGVTVAHGVGSREDEVVHRTVHTAIPMALLSGVVLTVVGVVFSETFLRMMGTPENVLKLSAVYMKIYFAGITFTMVYNFCAAILRAAGDTKSPLIYLSIAGIVNVALNVVFVTIFHMNVAGVALATTISQGISALLCCIHLMRSKGCSRLYLRKIRFHWESFRQIIQYGLPSAVQNSVIALANVVVQSNIFAFGPDAVNGCGAYSKLEGFAFLPVMCFSQSLSTFTGQNLGAKQHDRVKKGVGFGIACSLLMAEVIGILSYVFAPQLIGIFAKSEARYSSYLLNDPVFKYESTFSRRPLPKPLKGLSCSISVTSKERFFKTVIAFLYAFAGNTLFKDSS